jgi:phosphonate transport system substrate-binding protein
MEDSNRSSNAVGYLLMLVALLVLGVAVALLWVSVVRNPTNAKEYEQEVNQRSLQTVGFTDSRRSKLSDRYTDADGDLVADPPKNDKELLDPAVLTFSFIAVEDPSHFKEAWKDFVTYLAKETGKKVNYLEVNNSEDQLKALRDGKLHVAGLNTGLVPAAVNQCGFVPVSTLGNAEGKGVYQVEIIVRPSSTIQQVSDLRGKSLALTEIGSNSGYKAPLVILKRDFGLLPFKDYLILYSGGHEQSIAGIARGEFEAAAVANDVLARQLNDTIKPDQFRSIYKSPSFPRAAMGYVYNLKPDLAAKVKNALLKYDWKGTSLEKAFAPAGETKFVPVNYKTDWESVRTIDDAVGQSIDIK